jgi:predicted peroxiredoxin
MSRALVVKVTCGADAPERCNQGLTVAATAVNAGARVSLWLTGEGSWLGTSHREGFALPFAVPTADLVAVLIENGRVTVCAQCVQRRGITETDLLPGVRIAGSSAFVEEVVTPDTQALVY